MNSMLEITDSGANIHLERKSTPTMAPVMMENNIKARLPDGFTMESTHIATIHIPGLRKQTRQIHISPKIQISP